MTLFLEKQTWLAVDIETTGLNPWKYEIIEIGAVKFGVNGIESRFEVLIRPTRKQDPRSKEVHNISNEDLDSLGVSLNVGISKFISFIGNTDLIFHNAPFDMSFLTLAVKENGFKMPESYYYDTLYLSRTYFPERKSHSLSSLKKDFNIETGPSHRALADAEATSIVFLRIIKEKGAIISSKKTMQIFMKFMRKTTSFKLKLPKDLENIQRYFERFIKSSTFIKMEYFSKNKKGRVKRNVKPLEFMIFDQKIYIKSLVHPMGNIEIIPISGSIVYDKDLGMIKY